MVIVIMFGSRPNDPTFFIALALITLYKYLIHPVSFMLSVCPGLTGSFNYSLPQRVSSYVVAYSSCYCSLSALWDACPDPPQKVALGVTLSTRPTAGCQTSPRVSLPFPLDARLYTLVSLLVLSEYCLPFHRNITCGVMNVFFLFRGKVPSISSHKFILSSNLSGFSISAARKVKHFIDNACFWPLTTYSVSLALTERCVGISILCF